MQRATIILNGLSLVATIANFIRIYGGSYQSSYVLDVATITVLTSALFIITIAAAISTARHSFGSYARIAAMTAVVGHLVFFVAAVFGLIPGLGAGGDSFEPLMLVPMAVSAISVITLVRNIRGGASLD